MERITRREILQSAPILSISLTGCTSSGDSDDKKATTGPSSENGDKATTTEPTIEQYLNISEIEWVSYYLRFTVENVSNKDLEFVQVDSAVYKDNTRIGTMYTNIGELAAGIKVNAEIDYTVADIDGSLCEGTRYTITPSVTVETSQYETKYEYTDANICGEDSG